MSTKYTAEQARKILEQNQKGFSTKNTSDGLRRVLPFFFGLKHSPSDIKETSPAGVVLYNLCICYQKSGNVSEGVIGDVIWGFRQSGIPNSVTWDGFKELHRLGYIRGTDAAGIPLMGSLNEKMYYNWTTKFFQLLLERPDSNVAPITNEKLEDKRADDL